MTGPTRIPDNGQPQQRPVALQILPDRMSFIMTLQRATGADPSQIVNDMLALAIWQINNANLATQFAVALNKAATAPPVEEKQPDPDDVDPDTPEERLAKLRAIAAGKEPDPAQSAESAAPEMPDEVPS